MRYLVINSHVQSQQPRQHLLESLEVCHDIHSLPIVVVIGGADDHSVIEQPPRSDLDIEYVCVPYNAIDFTALIAVSERPYDDDDEFFYVHDTCVVKPGFVRKIMRLEDNPTNRMSCRLSSPSCNMGLYKYSLIRRHKDQLATYRDVPRSLQELKAVCVRDEDLLFRLDPTNTVHGRGITHVSEPTDYYGTGTMRRVEEYGDLDLCKIKANWFVKRVYALLP